MLPRSQVKNNLYWHSCWKKNIKRLLGTRQGRSVLSRTNQYLQLVASEIGLKVMSHCWLWFFSGRNQGQPGESFCHLYTILCGWGLARGLPWSLFWEVWLLKKPITKWASLQVSPVRYLLHHKKIFFFRNLCSTFLICSLVICFDFFESNLNGTIAFS